MKNNRYFFSYILLLGVLGGFLGCSEIGIGKKQSIGIGGGAPVAVTGAAIKGPLKQAPFNVFLITKEGDVGSLVFEGVTDENGQFTFTVPSGQLYEVVFPPGATYVDEKTGNEIQTDIALSTWVDLESGVEEHRAGITPMSTVAVMVVRNLIKHHKMHEQGTSQNEIDARMIQNDVYETLSEFFGADISKSAANINASAPNEVDDNSKKLAILSASFTGMHYRISAFIEAFSNDFIDLRLDGITMDDQGAPIPVTIDQNMIAADELKLSLQTSLDAFSKSTQNRFGENTDLISHLGNHNGKLDDENSSFSNHPSDECMQAFFNHLKNQSSEALGELMIEFRPRPLFSASPFERLSGGFVLDPAHIKQTSDFEMARGRCPSNPEYTRSRLFKFKKEGETCRLAYASCAPLPPTEPIQAKLNICMGRVHKRENGLSPYPGVVGELKIPKTAASAELLEHAIDQNGGISYPHIFSRTRLTYKNNNGGVIDYGGMNFGDCRYDETRDKDYVICRSSIFEENAGLWDRRILPAEARRLTFSNVIIDNGFKRYESKQSALSLDVEPSNLDRECLREMAVDEASPQPPIKPDPLFWTEKPIGINVTRANKFGMNHPYQVDVPVYTKRPIHDAPITLHELNTEGKKIREIARKRSVFGEVDFLLERGYHYLLESKEGTFTVGNDSAPQRFEDHLSVIIRVPPKDSYERRDGIAEFREISLSPQTTLAVRLAHRWKTVLDRPFPRMWEMAQWGVKLFFALNEGFILPRQYSIFSAQGASTVPPIQIRNQIVAASFVTMADNFGLNLDELLGLFEDDGSDTKLDGKMVDKDGNSVDIKINGALLEANALKTGFITAMQQYLEGGDNDTGLSQADFQPIINHLLLYHNVLYPPII